MVTSLPYVPINLWCWSHCGETNETAYNVFHHYSTEKRRIIFFVCAIFWVKLYSDSVVYRVSEKLITVLHLYCKCYRFFYFKFYVECVVNHNSSKDGSMLTLSAKSENLVNDFTDLSIRNDINDGDYDSHKVRTLFL